jgi:hypothetical protein
MYTDTLSERIACTSRQTHTLSLSFTHSHTHTLSLSHSLLHSLTHYIHSHTHHTFTYAFTFTCVHIHTYTHTDIHTHIHPRIPTMAKAWRTISFSSRRQGRRAGRMYSCTMFVSLNGNSSTSFNTSDTVPIAVARTNASGSVSMVTTYGTIRCSRLSLSSRLAN